MKSSLSEIAKITNMPVDGSGGTRRSPVDGSGGTRRMPVDGSGGTR